MHVLHILFPYQYIFLFLFPYQYIVSINTFSLSLSIFFVTISLSFLWAIQNQAVTWEFENCKLNSSSEVCPSKSLPLVPELQNWDNSIVYPPNSLEFHLWSPSEFWKTMNCDFYGGIPIFPSPGQVLRGNIPPSAASPHLARRPSLLVQSYNDAEGLPRDPPPACASLATSWACSRGCPLEKRSSCLCISAALYYLHYWKNGTETFIL